MKRIPALPRKTKNSNKISRQWAIRGGIAVLGSIALCAGYMFAYGQGYLNASKDFGEPGYKSAVIGAKLNVLYSNTKAKAAGVAEDGDVNTFYQNFLTPTLEAHVRQAGTPAIFCSDRVPDYVSVYPTNNGNQFSVHETFYNGAGVAATDKNFIVTYEWPSTKISNIYCP